MYECKYNDQVKNDLMRGSCNSHEGEEEFMQGCGGGGTTAKNSDLYKYDTRRKENLHAQSYNTRTLTCEKGVVNMAMKLHNKLPMEIKKVKGEIKFRHRLKR
jgi:hypothetical protein